LPQGVNALDFFININFNVYIHYISQRQSACSEPSYVGNGWAAWDFFLQGIAYFNFDCFANPASELVYFILFPLAVAFVAILMLESAAVLKEI
jgi:hypothetical protein